MRNSGGNLKTKSEESGPAGSDTFVYFREKREIEQEMKKTEVDLRK